jgi:hypothetical protein
MLSTPQYKGLGSLSAKKLNLKRRLMKKTVLKIKLLIALPILALLALMGLTLQSQAQFPQGSYTNNFANGGNTSPFSGSGSVASWIYWYNTPGGNSPITNDVTTPDPNGGTGAGSLEVYNPFGASGTQNVFFGTFDNEYGYDFNVLVNLANFSTVSFDIYVGTNNTPNTDGNFGSLGVGVVTHVGSNVSYEQFGAGEVTIPAAASNGWVHISVPVDHTIANITDVGGICFDFNSYNGYPTQPVTFWIGHLVMTYSGVPPPPPTAAISKAVPGLTQFADVPPTYNRQDLRTDQSGTANVTWYNNPGATYSWTIAHYPGPANPNFIMGLSLTPDPVASQIYSDPDYSATNDIWVALQNNADGTVTAGIAYKTNQAVGNSQLFAPPTQLVPYNNETYGLTVPSAIGTWSVTFNNNTSLTLTAPNGSSTNVTIPDYVAALYNGYVGTYLYSGPNGSTANLGQYCTFSAYKITGVGTPVNENLTSGGLVSPFLETISQNYFYTGNYTNHPPDQIFATSATNVYWLAWTLPDAGFSSVASPTLSNPTWTTLSGNIFQNGSQHWLALAPSQLPSAKTGFFALIQRNAYQLQVLLPGETNAPNTPTGKIGTPIPQTDSAETMVTINMCDQNWNIVNSSDQVNLTSSDELADLPSPDGFLVNGTLMEPVLFGSQSPPQFTVSASDDTTPSILPNTSSPVTVTQN